MSDLKKGVRVKLNGTIMWARLAPDAPDTKFKPAGEWSLSLVMDMDKLNKLKANGFIKKIAVDKDGVPFIKIKKACVTKAGDRMTPPKVLHTEGYEIDPATVGNGSKGSCIVTFKEITNTFGTFIQCYLETVYVDTLEVYEGGSDDAVEEEY